MGKPLYKCFAFILLCLLSSHGNAQSVITMSNNDTIGVNTCEYPMGFIYDDGGSSNQYSNYFSGYVILTASPGVSINVSGQYYTENCCDHLELYDGYGTYGTTLLADVRGSGSLSVVATSGFITIYFHSDYSVVNDGFELFYSISGTGTSCSNLPSNVVVSGVTQTSAQLNWSAPVGSGPFALTLNGGVPVTVYGSSYAMNTLSPGSVYNLSLCSVSDSASRCCWVNKTFRTTCNVITHNDIPYHYGFEDATGSGSGASIDTCWTRFSNIPQKRPSPSSEASHTGNYSMNLASNSQQECGILVMPEYVDTLSVLRVRFMMCNRATGGEAKVDVGVMTDPFDTNTFVKVASVRNPRVDFESRSVSFSNYMGSGRYVAFRVRGGASDVLIDDVVLERLSDCSIIGSMRVENVAVTSLAVSWSVMDQGTSATVGYEVTAVPVGGGTAVSTTVSRSPAIVTGLEAMTEYRIKVRPICTNNSFGSWDSVDATTMCTGYHMSTPSGSSTDYSTGVPVNEYWGNTVCQSIYTVSDLRAMGVTAGPINSMQFQWTESNNYNKVFDIYIGSTTQSVFSAYSFLTSGMTHVYSGNHPVGTSGLQTYAFSTSFYWDGVSNIVVTTLMNQPPTETQYSSGFHGLASYCGYSRTLYAYRDANAYVWSDLPSLTNINMSYSRPNITMSACDSTQTTCMGPMLVVDSVGFNDVFISWAPGGNETEWDVAYRLSSGASWTVVATHYTGTTYHFTGLNRSTEYEFRVTTSCGSSLAHSSIYVTTRCRQTTFNYDDLYADNVVCRAGSYSNPDMAVGVVDFGNQSNLSRHTVHDDMSETDYYSGHQLHTVPEGYCTSVRLGNWSTGSQAESITYTYTVDTADYDLLLLKYAAVLEDPNHSPEEQPRFTFLITNLNGDTVSPCYNADFISNANLGWNTGRSSSILWKDWTTVGVDLSPLHGQTIRIKLTSYDCDQGGHFGYAYFVIDVDNKALRSNSCSAEENTFYAPSGFAYSWYDSLAPSVILSTTDSLHVSSEGTFYCNLSFVGAPNDAAHSNCFFTMMAHSGVRYPYARFTPVLIDTASCRFAWMRMVNQSIVTRDSAHLDSMANGCESYLWQFDDGTSSGDINPRHAFTPGLHTVTLYAMLADGQCSDSVTHTFLLESPCMKSDTVSLTLCQGEVYNVFDTTLALSGEYLLDSIGADDSLFIRTVYLTVNPRSFDTVVQSVCDSYLWSETGNSYTVTGMYDDTLVNAYGCDSIRTLSLTVNNSTDSTVTVTACDSYTWHDSTFTTSTFNYQLSTINSVGCDSVVTLHLTILPVVYGDTVVTACDSFAWYGTVYNADVVDTLAGHYTSVMGCDSAVALHLTLQSSTQFVYYDTCVESDLPRHFGGITAYGDTVASFTTANAAGCDSVVTYRLTVLGNSHASFDTTFCQNWLPIQWYHRIFTGPGTQYDTIANHLGADSILTLTLHVSPVYSDTVGAAVCQGQSYTFEGTTYTDSGLYTHTLQTSFGCDSLRTLRLIINPATYGDTFATACDTFLWVGNTLVNSDNYTVAQYAVNSYGCDSSVTLHLTLNHSTRFDSVAEACDSYTWFGQTYTSAPAVPPVYMLANAAGCDSTVRLVSLTIHHSVVQDSYDTLCPAQLAAGYTWADTLLTTGTPTGLYTLQRTTVHGCDSTLHLHLTVFDNSSSSVYDTIVENQAASWQYHGESVTGDTTDMVVTIVNHHGCDSVVHYNLYIWRNAAYAFDSSICANHTSSFEWHGQPYADTLHWQLLTVHGADSLVTLAMHLLPVYRHDVYDTLCRDLLDSGYAWGDTIIHYDGSDTASYTRHLLSQWQCDSIVTLHIAVNPVYNILFYDTVYYGDTIQFEEMICTQPGVYVRRYVTAAGCDSLHTLYLYGRHIVTDSRTDTLCVGDTLVFGNHVITEAGIYVDTVVSGDFTVADTLLSLTVVVVPYPVVGFDTTVICGSYAYYSLSALTEASWLQWSSSPRDPSLEGQEHSPVVRVSPTVATLYTLEADYRSRPLCRVSDTIRIAPIDNITAVIECRPPHITMVDRELVAYDRSRGRVLTRRWQVFYNADAPFTVDETPLRLTVPHTVDSLAIALAVENLHCADTDTLRIDILHSGIYFPNVFTPSRESNNIFKGTAVGVHNFELSIYDRRGALVFHTTDMEVGWDGTHDGQPCRQETYVYRCRYSDEEVPDGYQTVTGTVTLVR